jgi:hypothetical protein
METVGIINYANKIRQRPKYLKWLIQKYKWILIIKLIVNNKGVFFDRYRSIIDEVQYIINYIKRKFRSWLIKRIDCELRRIELYRNISM